ncbi:MAG: amidohydrolase family protein [Desulfoplanes sp.]
MKYGNASLMILRPVFFPAGGQAPASLLIRSAHVMTMSPALGTIEDGGVLVSPGDDSRIVALGPYEDLCRRHQGAVMDLGDETIAPGLINAHSHLELSHLRGKPVFGKGFCAWAESLHEYMQTRADEASIRAALLDMCVTGTVATADMCGYEAGKIVDLLQEGTGPDILFLVQRMGFASPKGGRLKPYGFAQDLETRFSQQGRFAYAGHGLYSTHPETLQLTKAWCDEHAMPFAIHLAESAEEVELVQSGRGPLGDMLRDSRLLPRTFTSSGHTPVASAHALGLLGPRTIAVHCVHVTVEDVAILAATGTRVCLCPRSNEQIGVGVAPVEAMLGAGLRLCLGTDGLSSNDDLDLGAEIAWLRRAYPGLAFRDIMAMATINGAEALGIARDYGSLEPGKKAAFVRMSAVEEV